MARLRMSHRGLEASRQLLDPRYNGTNWSGLSEPSRRIGPRIHVRLAAAQKLGYELAGCRCHRDPEHVVSGRDNDVLQSAASIDDRLPVVRHRPPAEPLLLDRLPIGLEQIFGGRAPEEVEALATERA